MDNVETWWQKVLATDLGDLGDSITVVTGKYGAKQIEVPAFENDAGYGTRLKYYILKPLLFEIEGINKTARQKLKPDDVEEIIGRFLPFLPLLDHILFAVGAGKAKELAELLNDEFSVCDLKAPGPKFPGYGTMLESRDSFGENHFYIAFAEGDGRPGNPFASHVARYGERTPFHLALNIHMLIRLPNPRGYPPEIDSVPLSELLLKKLRNDDIIPLYSHKQNPCIDTPQDPEGTYIAHFSSVPLKYGLRLVFVRRYKVIPPPVSCISPFGKLLGTKEKEDLPGTLIHIV